MNFSTANSTFRQLMSNGLSYRVPSFQRDYSWSDDEWDDLWQDLDALVGEDPEPAHYMGYLVLRSEDGKAFEVIDGQQRMTTLSLLMLAAVARLTDLAAPGDPRDPQLRRAEQLRGNYIGYLDPVSLVPRSKLVLNRHDDGFYQNYLVPLERLPQRGLNASEHLLRRAFTWFRFRYNVICGRKSNEQETLYNELACDLSAGRVGAGRRTRSGRCVRSIRRTGSSGRRSQPRRFGRRAAATGGWCA